MMETPVGVSETVPDDALTIRDILKKHLAGMKIAENEMRTPIYDSGVSHESEDLESINRMDLSEKHEYAQMLSADIAERKKNLEAVEKAVKEKMAAARMAKQKKNEREEGGSHETADQAGGATEERRSNDSVGRRSNRVPLNTALDSRDD